jgi:hypothetical protein
MGGEDDHGMPIFSQQAVAGLEFTGIGPALADDPEGVGGGGFDGFGLVGAGAAAAAAGAAKLAGTKDTSDLGNKGGFTALDKGWLADGELHQFIAQVVGGPGDGTIAAFAGLRVLRPNFITFFEGFNGLQALIGGDGGTGYEAVGRTGGRGYSAFLAGSSLGGAFGFLACCFDAAGFGIEGLKSKISI